MKFLGIVLASTTLVITACAQAPVAAPETVASDACVENVFTTGSGISKRRKCASASDIERDKAQQDASAMRDEQMRRAAPRSMPGGQ